MSTTVKRLVPILVLVALGVVAAGYVLVKQRMPVPFQDTYTVRAVLPAADGVAPGLGQSVNVAGVKVGSISEARLENRRAVVTLRIDRDKLPEVRRDARVALRPITPLSDMRIELSPGTPGKPLMADGGTVPLSRTSSPVPLSDLLSSLDGDTRDFLATLLEGMGHGVEDRGPDLRKVLQSFGPTVEQMHEVTRVLARRQRSIARLVSNVSSVTRAAASDGRLADLVVSGNRTLEALARQDEPLRRTLEELPGALATAGDALTTTGRLARSLQPTIDTLTPPVRDLPKTLRTVGPVADELATTLRTQFRPATKELQPLARALGPALRSTSAVLPDLSRVTQLTTYLLNQVGYNPPGPQEGTLFWLAWAAHNFNTFSTTGDAHGNIVRVLLNLNCTQFNAAGEIGFLLKLATGSVDNCPNTDNTALTGARDRRGGR
ncbi:MAG: MlaD family protein [Solirubrobacteraceae bacterium]|nr:MlaD family protein [Solirubrobacteraceae bacterium]